MRLIAPILVFALCGSVFAAPATQPVKKPRGPSAASLATAYSGPVKFDPRVLAAERKAAFNPDSNARAATWRYYYSAPIYWYSGCGFGWYGGGCYGGWGFGGHFGGHARTHGDYRNVY